MWWMFSTNLQAGFKLSCKTSLCRSFMFKFNLYSITTIVYNSVCCSAIVRLVLVWYIKFCHSSTISHPNIHYLILWLRTRESQLQFSFPSYSFQYWFHHESYYYSPNALRLHRAKTKKVLSNSLRPQMCALVDFMVILPTAAAGDYFPIKGLGRKRRTNDYKGPVRAGQICVIGAIAAAGLGGWCVGDIWLHPRHCDRAALSDRAAGGRRRTPVHSAAARN